MNGKTGGKKSLDKCLPSYLTRVLSLYILLAYMNIYHEQRRA